MSDTLNHRADGCSEANTSFGQTSELLIFKSEIGACSSLSFHLQPKGNESDTFKNSKDKRQRGDMEELGET